MRGLEELREATMGEEGSFTMSAEVVRGAIRAIDARLRLLEDRQKPQGYEHLTPGVSPYDLEGMARRRTRRRKNAETGT